MLRFKVGDLVEAQDCYALIRDENPLKNRYDKAKGLIVKEEENFLIILWLNPKAHKLPTYVVSKRMSLEVLRKIN